MTIQVGAVVRAPRGVAKALKGRAVVCLIEEEEESACILWEDLAPRPLKGSPSPFVVTPMVPRTKEEREDTVSLSQLNPLLDFEQESVGGNESDAVSLWKERGDALLRLGDGSAAISYYEAGLAASSILQIGSTVLISQKDGFQVAEVDCIEDGNVDVTFIDEEERTVPESEVKLCLLAGQEILQVRILLNLTRCLMQVAELEDSQVSAYYRRSAAISCSMALAILETVTTGEESLHTTALLLRSKAYASRSKWKLAMADAQTLTSDHPEYKEGRTSVQKLESQMTRQQRTNQQLAKSMCAWVSNATAATDVDGEREESSVSQGADEEKHQSPPDAQKLNESPDRKSVV